MEISVNSGSIPNVPQADIVKTELHKTEKVDTQSKENSHEKQQETQQGKLNEKQVTEAIETINEKLIPTQTELNLSIHEKTNDIVVKVLDKETKEVIREVPSEKVLDMVAKMREMSGLFVDEKR